MLVAGVPGKVVRELTAQEIAWKHEGTLAYQALARRRLTAEDVSPGLKPLVATKR